MGGWQEGGRRGMELKVHLAPCVRCYCHFGLTPFLHLRLRSCNKKLRSPLPPCQKETCTPCTCTHTSPGCNPLLMASFQTCSLIFGHLSPVGHHKVGRVMEVRDDAKGWRRESFFLVFFWLVGCFVLFLIGNSSGRHPNLTRHKHTQQDTHSNHTASSLPAERDFVSNLEPFKPNYVPLSAALSFGAMPPSSIYTLLPQSKI